MPQLATKINPNSDQFKSNTEELKKRISLLEDVISQSLHQGEEKHIQRAKKNDKLLARERIEMLFDEDSPQMELLPFAGYQRKCFTVGSTMIASVGLIHGKIILAIANVGTVKGGAIEYISLQKTQRLNQIALENRLPVIYLVESAGANLPDQVNIFNAGGNNFYEITRRSKEKIPTIAIVFGNSTAGGAYIPAMCDYMIMVKDKSQVFLAGPPLVKMATGEEVDAETLGGANTHTKISGVSDFKAENELHAIKIARDIVNHLKLKTSSKDDLHFPKFEEPKYDPEELLGIVSTDLKKPFDMREIIARVVDGSDFMEFKPDYGSTLVTGFATIQGYQVGIIGNNGVLFSEAANKGTQFIELCNKNGTPLLFMQNITGFMVGKKYEHQGIIKHGANMINAVANSKVPAITLIVGSSYGAGNYAMCGRGYNPRFLFTWPNSKIAVMGGEQLSGVMEIIQRQAAEKSGRTLDEIKLQEMKDQIQQKMEVESDAFFASGHLWDDAVIDPRQTRNYLGFALGIVHNAPIEKAEEYGVFRF